MVQNAGISAPTLTSDTDLPAGLAARLKRKVTNLATANTQAAGNNPAMPQRSQNKSDLMYVSRYDDDVLTMSERHDY